MAPGVYVEATPFFASEHIGGTDIHAEIGWENGRPIIDRLTITRRPGGEIHTSILRGISLPDLLNSATSEGVRLYSDPEGKIDFDESRQDGESLEQWAARLGYAAAAMRISPAEHIADVQKITVGTANQRLVVARKMGLIDSQRKKKEEI